MRRRRGQQNGFEQEVRNIRAHIEGFVGDLGEFDAQHPHWEDSSIITLALLLVYGLASRNGRQGFAGAIGMIAPVFEFVASFVLLIQLANVLKNSELTPPLIHRGLSMIYELYAQAYQNFAQALHELCDINLPGFTDVTGRAVVAVNRAAPGFYRVANLTANVVLAFDPLNPVWGGILMNSLLAGPLTAALNPELIRWWQQRRDLNSLEVNDNAKNLQQYQVPEELIPEHYLCPLFRIVIGRAALVPLSNGNQAIVDYDMLCTWSAVKRYIDANNENPVQTWLEPRIQSLSLPATVAVQFPLILRVGKTVSLRD